jgi:hypothetical protein
MSITIEDRKLFDGYDQKGYAAVKMILLPYELTFVHKKEAYAALNR